MTELTESPVAPEQTLSLGGALLLFSLAMIPVLAGLFVLNLAIFEPRRAAHEAEGWIAVPCTIQKVEIESLTLGKAGKTGSSSKGFKPRIEYEYEWEGVAYTGSRFWLGTTLWKSWAEVRRLIAPYQPGRPAECFVNPQRPAEAVLTRSLFEREPIGWTQLGWLGGVSALIIGGVLFLNSSGPLIQITSEAVAGGVPVRAQQPNSPSFGKLCLLWLSAFGWNTVVAILANYAWIGGAPVSFFLVFLSIFWLVGLIIIAGAVSTTVEFLSPFPNHSSLRDEESTRKSNGRRVGQALPDAAGSA